MAKGLDTLFTQPTTKLFVALLTEALEPDSPVHDRYVAIHDTLRAACKRWLDRFAPLAGSSTEALAVAIVGAGIGIHQQWLVAPDRVDLGQSLAALRALVAGIVSTTET
jgi:TetR/AcrR family acrAB operon transcriptional repressor